MILYKENSNEKYELSDEKIANMFMECPNYVEDVKTGTHVRRIINTFISSKNGLNSNTSHLKEEDYMGIMRIILLRIFK